MQPNVHICTKHGFQTFISRVDPVLSHINSFIAIEITFVQTHPEVAGLMWRQSLYIDYGKHGLHGFEDLGHLFGFSSGKQILNLLFSKKWRKFSPERDFEE